MRARAREVTRSRRCDRSVRISRAGRRVPLRHRQFDGADDPPDDDESFSIYLRAKADVAAVLAEFIDRRPSTSATVELITDDDSVTDAVNALA